MALWSWLNDNGAGLSALAAILTALIAVFALLATVRDSRERTRPMVVAELVPAEQNPDAIDFVVRNYGQSLARDVTVTFDPPITVPDGADAVMTPYLIRRYKEPIHTLSPGQDLRNIWWSGRDLGGEDLENSEPTPDQVLVQVSYRGPEGKKRYSDSFPLDVETVMMTTYSTSSTSVPGRLASVDKSLKSIDGSLKATAKAVTKGAASASKLVEHKTPTPTAPGPAQAQPVRTRHAKLADPPENDGGAR